LVVVATAGAQRKPVKAIGTHEATDSVADGAYLRASVLRENMVHPESG
jgi:hypothetical protein